jgi:hypothetical protein
VQAHVLGVVGCRGLLAMLKASERFACLATAENRTTQHHNRAAATPTDPGSALG